MLMLRVQKPAEQGGRITVLYFLYQHDGKKNKNKNRVNSLGYRISMYNHQLFSHSCGGRTRMALLTFSQLCFVSGLQRTKSRLTTKSIFFLILQFFLKYMEE